MKIKDRGAKISKKKALSIIMALTNGVNSLAPIAMPLAAVTAEIPKAREGTVDDLLATNFNRGGQIMDSLFFTTAYAYTSDVSSGSVNGEIIDDGGTQNVYGTGSTTNVTLGSATVGPGGTQNVSSGGSTSNTTLNINGWQKVYSGGSADSTTINSFGRQTVYNGGSATGTTISDGSQLVSSGGSAASTTIISGGYQSVWGSATGTTISNGHQYVYGSATGTTISAGDQYVYGSATSTTINLGGEQYVSSGGSADSTIINSGGYQEVDSGAVVTDTTVNSGGVIQMNSGAALSGTTSLILGTINLSGTSGTYSIANLAVTNGGTVTLANGTTAGNQLNITNMSGGAKFVINTDLAHGQSDQINITSATNSQNTVQVNYDPGFATGQNVSGSATFATVSSGNATFTAASTEYGAYSYTPTLSETTSGGVETWTITGLNVPSGVSETMHTASNINASNLTLWRSENNDLTRRMGDLRNASGQEGEWARVYRGSTEATDSYGRQTTAQYTVIQGGYDIKHSTADGTWYTGYAAGYLSADAALARGNGTGSSLTAGAYGAWLGNKGHFVDVIAKVGRLRTSYYDYLNDAVSTRVDGSYANWGTSLSVEYGYRKKLANSWYLEPQAEINLGRISAADYITSDNTAVHNQSVNSTIGRLGLAIGRNINQKNNFYAKVSIAREFSAHSAVTMSTGGLTPVTMEQNLKQTWLEYALGLTTAFNNRTNGYMEISKTTGSPTRTPWLVNAGIRWNF